MPHLLMKRSTSAMPNAYVICYVDISDQAKYDDYRVLAGPAVAEHGGEYVARGGQTAVLEGDLDPQRVVVIKFPDVDAAKAWYNSPQYTAARKAREGASKGSFIVVEGA